MKRLIASYVFSLLGIAVLGLALVPFVSANTQFARILQRGDAQWTITVSFLPILPAVIYSLLITLLFIKRRQDGSTATYRLFPLIFPAADEREREIHTLACRKAFAVFWMLVPIAAGFMCFYPLFSVAFPLFPIVVLLLLSAVQVSVYYTAARRIYRE